MTKDELLDKLDEAQTAEEIKELGQQLLTLDPNDAQGKLALWQAMDDEEAFENMDMLAEALDTIRAVVEAKEAPGAIDEDRDSEAYAAIMMNLGGSLVAAGKTEEAYKIAQELAGFDDEGLFPGRMLLYRCMLELGLYEDILKQLDEDPLETVVGEHARAIAMLELGRDRLEVLDAINYAISLAPDVPFFVLGMWDMPEFDDDVDEDDIDTIYDARCLIEPWSKTDERLAALGAPTFLFGYLTDRIDDQKEMDILKEGYKENGVLEKVEEAKKEIAEMEKKGNDLEEIDATALGLTGDILEALAQGQEN